MDENSFLVVQKKYEAKRIKELSDAEILGEAVKAFQRIHVITGWNLPTDKEYMKILSEEFCLKLKEDFHMMNFSEIVYAFRKNGIGIKDWGKNMNLDLICNVLGDYCIERTRISFEEENIMLERPKIKINSDEEIDNYYRKWTEEFYQRIKSGKIEQVPAYCEEILIKDGLIEKGTPVAAFFVQALNQGRENIYKKNKA